MYDTSVTNLPFSFRLVVFSHCRIFILFQQITLNQELSDLVQRNTALAEIASRKETTLQKMKEKYEEELKAQEKMNQIQKTLADNTAKKDKVCLQFLNFLLTILDCLLIPFVLINLVSSSSCFRIFRSTARSPHCRTRSRRKNLNAMQCVLCFSRKKGTSQTR